MRYTLHCIDAGKLIDCSSDTYDCCSHAVRDFLKSSRETADKQVMLVLHNGMPVATITQLNVESDTAAFVEFLVVDMERSKVKTFRTCLETTIEEKGYDYDVEE